MISNSKKFIFIHIPKTAGMSIQSALSEYSNRDVDEFKRGVLSVDKTIPAFNYVDGPYKDYYKFSCVRNPYERIISMIFYKDKQWNPKLFNTMCDQARNSPSPQYRSADYFLLHKGKLVVDRIIKYENMQSDFDLVCDEIGIPRRQLPVLNKSKHKHYSYYYTPEMIDKATRAYKAEIDMFNYEFEYAE